MEGRWSNEEVLDERMSGKGKPARLLYTKLCVEEVVAVVAGVLIHGADLTASISHKLGMLFLASRAIPL